MPSQDFTRCAEVSNSKCPFAKHCKRVTAIQVEGVLYSFAEFEPGNNCNGYIPNKLEEKKNEKS